MLLLAVRFLVELLGFGALALMGATAPSESVWRVVLGIGAPLAFAIAGGLGAAPKAQNGLSLRARSLIGTLLLVGVAVLVALTGQPGWGIAFAAVVVIDQALILAFNLDDVALTLAATAPGGKA